MKKLGLGLIILLCILSIPKLQASHLMGADITWTCVGLDSFLVKVIVYRDCNGITLGSSPINFVCETSGATITTLSIAVGTPVDITPVCRTSCSRCQSTSCSFPYGVHRYTMQGLVKLNGAGTCCNIVMSWAQNARNAAITTMPGAGSDNLYIEAKLNRCQNPCDNSPSFTNTPVLILCTGQDFTFNNGVQDIDVNNTGGPADSITYEWTPPMGGAGNNLTYSGQYTYDKPLYFMGFPNDTLPLPQGFHLNHQTGDIQFRPMNAQVTVMVVKVNVFRNGNKIAEIKRDIELIIFACTSNKAPYITTTNNVRSKSINASQTVTFNFSTNDTNANDSVTISWNDAIPGATWTNTNGQTKHPTATLSWTPATSKAGSLPYSFTVTAKDNACPLRAQFTQAYQIYVLPEVVKINPIDKRCINGSILYLNNFVTVYGKSSTKGLWSSPSAGLISGDTFDPAVAGVSTSPGWKVVYEYIDSATSKIYKDSSYVNVYALPKPFAGYDDTVCTGAKISLTGYPLSSKGVWRGTGVTGSYPKWKFNPDTTSIVNGGIYELIYHYTDNNSCENEDTAKFTVFKTLTADAGIDKDFCVDGTSLTLTGLPAGGSWTGNGVAANVFYPTLAKLGVHELKYSYTNVICTSTDSVIYTVWNLPVVTAATQSGNTTFCRTEGLIQLNGQPSGTGGIWSGPGTNGNYFNTAIGADVFSDYTLRYEYSDTHSCKNFADLKVWVVPEPVVIIDPSRFCTGIPYTISAIFNHADSILWWKGTKSDGVITGSINSPTIGYVPGNGDLMKLYFWLYIKTIQTNRICAPTYDSIQVLIGAVPTAVLSGNPSSGSVPLTVQFTDLSSINIGMITAWEWDFGDGNKSVNQNPVHTYQNGGSYTVKLVVTGDAGCIDSMVKTNYITTTNGINNSINPEKLKFYPNPANSLLYAEYSGYKAANLLLTDILGHTTLETTIIPGKNEINIQNYKPGIYFIYLDGMIAGKVMIE